MEIIEFEDYLSRLPELLKEHNSTVIVKSSNTCILYGEGGFNNPTNLPAYKTHGFGGVIVNFEGDISVGNYTVENFDFGKNFIQKLAEYLKSRGLNCEILNNDIIVDGQYKVASYMSQRVGEVIYTAIHISINVDLELIKNICTKEMFKIPHGLSDYGITQDEIINFVKRG